MDVDPAMETRCLSRTGVLGARGTKQQGMVGKRLLCLEDDKISTG